MTDKLGIVVVGYKNLSGIARLLQSLQMAYYADIKDIPLIISIDHSDDNSVVQYAESFSWEYGPKYVISHSERLGLKCHILKCGSYMEEYGLDAIAVLEDDIYVSPSFFSFFREAVAFYSHNMRIAGISLYKHETNILAKKAFIDYKDGGDTFFVKYAQSWGQIWLAEQWKAFAKWLEAKAYMDMDDKTIPPNVLNWKESWLKYHIMYCIDTNSYFVYPRYSFTTNFSDIGTHNSLKTTQLQVPMYMGNEKNWVFNELEDTRARYDAFFESEALIDFLKIDDLSVDLSNSKPIPQNKGYLITNRILPYKVVKSWGLQLRPIEANVFEGIQGNDIFLYDLQNPQKGNRDRYISVRRYEYELKSIYPLCIENIQYCFKRIIARFSEKIGVKKSER